MYKKVSTELSFPEREAEILKFWKENHIFEKSVKMREGAPTFVFYDGPPTANGRPHIGHVLTRVIKDLIPRYRTMKGYDVPRKAGWDTHGLPVELEVEKQLGLNGKEQIEEYGIAPFIDRCRESVWKYKSMWEEFSDVVGFWADMDNPYVTYHNEYIESVWWALKQIYDKGLLYKGFKIVPYCPRCGTPLSSHEVAQGYKDVKEKSAVVKFKAKGEDAYILAWTTTPWTLPSNVALCVHPTETYIKFRANGETYYMAEALVGSLFEEYEVLERMQGTDLEYKEYEPLFDLVHPKEKGWYICCDTYVTMSDGTGIVHIAPAFGEDDAQVGRKYGLPFVQLVDGAGKMKENTPWAGVFVKDADPMILKALAELGLLFSAPTFEHSYPYCWRCDTPLIYYARESWFIEMSKVKEELIANNNTVNWIPPSMGKGRFGDWLENIQDWAISRDRYWGTPLNIWTCECGHKHAVGSIAELRELAPDCPADIELHRPYIDQITFKCPECGGVMHRVPEVIDCWFDSGSMPFAQHHYPFENEDLFKEQFPADFISEAVDQTRGWFYSLLAISTLVFHRAPYKNVLVLGHVQDKDGQKMSKSKGNAVEPLEALHRFGADAIRWYFEVNSAPWLPNRFHDKAVVEGQRKFLGTLWNTYAFYVLYAEIAQFDPTKHTLNRDALSVMDRWLLSKLNHLIREVDEDLENYRITESARALQEFVEELSNWYVRRCRDRFWTDAIGPDQESAYMTLYTALVTTAKLAAPLIPFMTDAIYRNLVCSLDPTAPESVHLCDYPACDESFFDDQLEREMDSVREVVTLGRAARNGSSIKNRQPLSEMLVQTEVALSDDYLTVIREELNLKAVRLVDDLSELLDYSFKPQLKTVGPKFGKQVGAIRTALARLDGAKAKAELDREGVLPLTLDDGSTVQLALEDLLIETKQREGYYTMQENDVTVALNTTLTDDLIEEGFIREVISKIQTMRKDAGFEVTDRITVTYSGSAKIDAIIASAGATIADEVLALSMTEGAAPSDGFTKEQDINGEKVTLTVQVVR